MIVDSDYIRNLSNAELANEWKKRGYKEYYESIGKVSGLGWDTAEALRNYWNYKDEIENRCNNLQISFKDFVNKQFNRNRY